jgi:selenocysteine-specific elongation factor
MTSGLTKHIVLGMAGHIDHGKTSIVKALTGIDTDRLKEEKERGMTTDLGFAFLGNEIAIIDVPGHEKFVKTMVAGVNTVDIALLVVAADDGVMPQTREHLEILKLLQVPVGLIALNKVDLANDEWLEMVKGDLRTLVRGTFLEDAPIIPVSAISGKGIEDLKREIQERVRLVRGRRDKGVFRLPIDRVFTIKGFGTVVAGTVLGGSVKVDDSVELLPQGKTVRVRGIQVHDHTVMESGVGLRTAINLMGVEKELIERGDVLAQPGFFKPTSMVDAKFTYLSGEKAKLENRTRIRFHVGTTEVIGRIILLEHDALQPGGEELVQVHFEKPIVADAGDRFVVRSYSPVRTIGGGAILDVHPEKHKRLKNDVLLRLSQLDKGDPEQLVMEQMLRSSHLFLAVAELAKLASVPPEVCRDQLDSLLQQSKVAQLEADGWYASSHFENLKRKIAELLDKLHRENPLKIGLSASEVHSRLKPPVERKLFDHACKVLQTEAQVDLHGDRMSLRSHAIQLSSEHKVVRDKIERALTTSPLMPPGQREITVGLGKDAEKVFALMIESGDVIRLEQDIVMHRSAIEHAKLEIAKLLAAKHQAGLGEIREHLGITRKFALPLLLYLDGIGFTERDGDVRKLRRST